VSAPIAITCCPVRASMLPCAARVALRSIPIEAPVHPTGGSRTPSRGRLFLREGAAALDLCRREPQQELELRLDAPTPVMPAR
jgi:hypothetical protein